MWIHRLLCRSSGSARVAHGTLLCLLACFTQRTDITQQIRDTGKPRKEYQIDPKASYNLRRSDITRTRELTKYLVQTPAGSIMDNSTSSSNPAGGADVARRTTNITETGESIYRDRRLWMSVDRPLPQ